MLELMKQRIEEANKPVVKSVELENAEKACAVAKQSLAAKQNDYTQEKVQNFKLKFYFEVRISRNF